MGRLTQDGGVWYDSASNFAQEDFSYVQYFHGLSKARTDVGKSKTFFILKMSIQLASLGHVLM